MVIFGRLQVNCWFSPSFEFPWKWFQIRKCGGYLLLSIPIYHSSKLLKLHSFFYTALKLYTLKFKCTLPKKIFNRICVRSGIMPPTSCYTSLLFTFFSIKSYYFTIVITKIFTRKNFEKSHKFHFYFQNYEKNHGKLV